MVGMRSLKQLVESASATPLDSNDIARLHLLLADWQVLADLAAADLVLWVPTEQGRFIAIAHCRPGTSSTVHVEDIIGLYLPSAREERLKAAMDSKQMLRSTSARWAGTYSVSEVCVPVWHNDRVIAVITRETNIASPRLATGLEEWGMKAADTICEMIAAGVYPYESTPATAVSGNPRVADGAIFIDADGRVAHRTPPAVSCLRRLGIRHSMKGRILAEEITDKMVDATTVDESTPLVLMGRASWTTEISVNSSSITMRALPLIQDGQRIGAVILTRDVSEKRLHEQQLITKDATIREIHHRVKNNLQRVSALLRLQSRRSKQEGVREALAEAERRVQAIATVHEALSHNVDETVAFDDVLRSILRLVGTVTTTDRAVQIVTTGTFGILAAEQAQALATVLNELVANSIEHGLKDRDGHVWVDVKRECSDMMIVTVTDDGIGFEDGTPLTGLGTQIVNQMVRGDLRGTIEWSHRPEGGTVVTLRIRQESAWSSAG